MLPSRSFSCETLVSSSWPKSRVTRSRAPSPARSSPSPNPQPASARARQEQDEPAHQRTVTRSPKEGTRPRLEARTTYEPGGSLSSAMPR